MSAMTMTAPARSVVVAAKALSISLGSRASMGCSCMPNARAASCACRTCSALPGLAGFQRRATREILGTTSSSSSSCFPTRSGSIKDSPAMFPPGRATLATNPIATGSATIAMTMGIVAVAALPLGPPAHHLPR